ncbi:MAG: hypothetical protein H0W25_13520 [Acidimicrobiia bacterium]|nr:hypothetical protein [Acidimicrobiia bacterium]
MSLGALALRVVSETRVLRELVENRLGWATSTEYQREGLLLSRPAEGGSVGKPSWVLYESGSIVLRRTPQESDAVNAACFHLVALEAATTSPHLALRLRTILLPGGDAVLADAQALHDLAGHDRRLGARGCLVLPTTVALVDPDAMELILPDQDVDQAVPTGRRAISQVVIRQRDPSPLAEADPLLALAAAALRDPELDLQATLQQIARLAEADAGVVRLAPVDDIIALPDELGLRRSS